MDSQNEIDFEQQKAMLQTLLAESESAKENAELIVKTAKEILAKIQNAEIEVQSLKQHAGLALTDIQQSIQQISDFATSSEIAKNRSNEAASSSEQYQSSLKTFAENVNEFIVKYQATDERIAKYETDIGLIKHRHELEIEKFKVAYNEELTNIQSLLPMAASTGLGFAFDERRQNFLGAKNEKFKWIPFSKWELIFIGSILALIGIAWYGLTQNHNDNFQTLMLSWLSRLPIAAGLIWLAIYSSKESALAKRLEEDYGYKSAIATSLVGFHKQVEKLNVEDEENSALKRLYENTLKTISTPPGRIYDKQKLTSTPTAELLETLKKLIPNQIGQPSTDAVAKVDGSKNVNTN